MPKAKSTTKDLSVKELKQQIIDHKAVNCAKMPKKKADLQALAIRLNLPVEKKRVATAPRARKPKVTSRAPLMYPRVKKEKSSMINLPDEFNMREFPEGF